MLAQDTTTQTRAAYLARVAGICERIRQAAPDIEAARQMPAEIAECLRQAGMFAVAAPAQRGGLELDPIAISEAIETLAAADASAAWCAMIGCDSGFLTSFVDEAAAEELFPDPTLAGVFVLNPTGVATPVDGGYKVTGRWTFASGSTHAGAYALGCIAMTPEGPRMIAPDTPEIRVIIVPAGEAQVIDTWVTTGVRGSGSHDVAVSDVFVPEGHTFQFFPPSVTRGGALYRLPTMFLSKLAAVPLGIARGAIDDVVAIAATKRSFGSTRVIQDQGWLHTAVARAEMKHGQARSFYYESLGGVWAHLEAGGVPPRRAQSKLMLSMLGAMDNCLEIVDSMYKAGGSSALYSRGTLDRRLRDIHTIAQHTTFGLDRWAENGKVMLGIPVSSAMFFDAPQAGA